MIYPYYFNFNVVSFNCTENLLYTDLFPTKLLINLWIFFLVNYQFY